MKKIFVCLFSLLFGFMWTTQTNASFILEDIYKQNGDLYFNINNSGGLTTSFYTLSIDNSGSLSNLNLVNSGALKISGLNRTNGNFIISNNYYSGGNLVTEKSNGINIIGEKNIYLSNRISFDSNKIFLWFKNPIKIPTMDTITEDVYSIKIDGNKYPLNIDFSEYEDGKYYINSKYIVFPANNIKGIYKNKIPVTFMVSGKESGYVTLDLEKYNLEEVNDYWLDSSDNAKTISFNIATNINSLNGYDFILNGSIYPKDNITISGNRFILKYPISSFTNVIDLFIRNTNTGESTNKIYLNPNDYLGVLITDVYFGDKDTNSTLITLDFDTQGAVAGDISNFKLNINGEDWDYAGVKIPRTNGSGSVIKDYYGNISYKTVRQLSLYKNGGGVSFRFYLKDLKNGENKIYFKNTLTGKISNTFVFSKNENHELGDISYAITNNTKSQILLCFTGKTESKTYDFTSSNYVNNFSLGNLSLEGLNKDKNYILSFKITTNQKYNPFKTLVFDNQVLTQSEDLEGNIVFYYNKLISGAGNFKEVPLNYNLNELYNVDVDIKLKIENFDLKDTSNETVNYLDGNKGFNVLLKYLYDFGECFDEGKDFCKFKNLLEPSLSLDINSIQNTNNTLDENVIVSNSGTGEVNPLSNIRDYVFISEKFNSYEEILKNRYILLLKQKNIGIEQKKSYTTAVNDLLKVLYYLENTKQSEINIKEVKQRLIDDFKIINK